jgi:carbon monoxide dehydrogenase subunit G
MAPLRETIEISRSPDDVFAYVSDLSRHGEWQEGVVSASMESEGPTKVGTRARMTRRVGPRSQAMTVEVTAHDPPRSFATRTLDGPIRATAKATVEPADEGSHSRVTVELDLTGHGAGKLLLPLARSQARRDLPAAQQRLKELLESGGA